jgi:hypothetical protein
MGKGESVSLFPVPLLPCFPLRDEVAQVDRGFLVMSERKLRAYVDIPTHLGPDVTMNQTITNISLSGCLVVTDTHLAVGSTLSLSIPISGKNTLRLKGRVVREHGQEGYGIGFEAMSDEDRRALALLIAETDEGMN